MGIIRKEQAEEVSAFSFGEESGGPIEASEWHLGGSNPDALPPPNVAGEGTGIPLPDEGQGPGDPNAGMEEPPQEQIVQPIFEVPEEILAGFYENVVMVGLEDGKNQVLAELQVLQERYASALDELAAVGRELAAQNQVQLMGLSCMIAERLVRDELKVRPERLLELVADALARGAGDDTVHLKCSPGDHEYLVQRRPQLEEGLGGSVRVRVELDESLEYGDFQIESSSGLIDGRVGERVADVQRGLTEQTEDV